MFSPIALSHIRFQAKQPVDVAPTKKHWEELIAHFPEGGLKCPHYNGIGIGVIGDYAHHPRRMGIKVQHETAASRQIVLDHLLAMKRITPTEEPGRYRFKHVLVEFDVVGKLSPCRASCRPSWGQSSCSRV